MTEEGEYDPDEVFFLSFQTRDEDEALKLAACVCGKRMAARSLVMINEEGRVMPVF